MEKTVAEKRATKKDWERLFREVYRKCIVENSFVPEFNPDASEWLNARIDMERVSTNDLLEMIEKLCVKKEGWFFADRLLEIIEKRENTQWLKSKKNRKALLRVMSDTLPRSKYILLNDIQNQAVKEHEQSIRPDLEHDCDKALDALTERERIVVELTIYGKMNQHDIAKRLSISQQAVSKTFKSAIKKLKKRLYKYVSET